MSDFSRKNSNVNMTSLENAEYNTHRKMSLAIKRFCVCLGLLHYDVLAGIKVQKWTVEVTRGREYLEDDPRSGRPLTATSVENIGRVHHMLMNDRRLTERVENIAHNELGMTKASS